MPKNNLDNRYQKICRSVHDYLLQFITKEESDYILNLLGTGESFRRTICLLPTWFSSCLNNKSYLSFSKLELLGEANFKAWIAYTLYDYLRDGKIKKEKFVMVISIANICNNSALNVFLQLGKSKFKVNYILDLFNTIDKFYIREKNILHSKDSFKNFSRKISDKSIAAAITAILVVPENNKEKIVCKKIIGFFKCYFRARQLSDDLDDYQKDLRLKIKTPATILLKQGLTEKEMRVEMRKTIDQNLILARKSLSSISSFDFDTFNKLYIKAC